jgi:glycolate oxidase iron-sulfur subunit
MKRLKDFEKELNKCSKCGLCQAICPLYKLTQNECAVSKGKFTMLYGVVRGDLKLSKNINKYLDLCLKCGKCKDFCPSDIDVEQILATAKYEYRKTKLSSKFIDFLQSKFIFDNLIKFGEILSKTFRKRNKTQKNSIKLMYFKGCINKIFPNTDKYISKIFKNIPIEIMEPEFNCCGLPFLSEGNLERFLEVAKFNSKLLNYEYDYLITDCASCESTLNSYDEYIDNQTSIKEKSISWGELIAKQIIKFKFNKKIKVTYHKPCHQINDNYLKKILNNCENIEYIEMKDYDECCGFAGSFAIKNPSISTKISKIKAQNIKNTNADYVITTCPSCILGLKQGLLLSGGKTKVVTLLEFLSKANEIEY